MPTSVSEQTLQTLEVTKRTEIAAPMDMVFETILEQIGPLNERGDGMPLPMTLEAWPGGRWFRDFGNNAGHLWGHVQSIRPNDLLEIQGPMFMSAPVISHVLYRLTQNGTGTVLEFSHRAVGQIPPQFLDGVALKQGWSVQLERVRAASERRAK
jgi:uncharacterized protein YndB with AHSA1/START domain